MPASTLPLHSAFDPGELPRHIAEAVWRGAELGDPVARTVSSGFTELDKELPGGGWPTHSLTELLVPQSALCEWRLLGRSIPSILASGGQVYLIAPPKQPHVGGLAQLGVPAEQVVWIHASTPVDRLWATEQIIKSDPSGAVLSWLPQARPEQIRRLQIHAQSCDAPVFLFRPSSALHDTSPAPLRVALTLAQGWHLEVRIPKRRGASLDGALYLTAMPENLESVVPPRLKTAPASAVAPKRKEVPDARSLGRVATHPSAGQPVSH